MRLRRTDSAGPGKSVPRLVACDAAAFDRAIAGFDDVLPEQSACFAAARWRGREIEHRLMPRGEAVAAAATIVIVRLAGSGIAAVKWGPLWRRSGEAADPARYAAALAALADEYTNKRGLMLSVMPPADPVWGATMTGALTDRGFAAGEAQAHPARYFVDLAPAEAAIRSGLSSKWRYNLGKSEAQGFALKIVEGRDGAERFRPLYDAMLARKRFQDDSPIDTLPAMFEAPVAALHPVTVLVEEEGVPVAGAVITRIGDTARYLYGASSDEGLDRKPGFALQWAAIRWLRANTQCRWYALGGTDGSHGLAQFKKGMVGRSGVICPEPPAFDFAATNRARLTGRLLYRLRALKTRASAGMALAGARR